MKNVQTGDLLTDKEVSVEPPSFGFPEPVMSFAVTPKIKGEEEKVASAIKRLAEEDRRCASGATRRPARRSSRG